MSQLLGVGIIGLSAESSWAVNAHLPYLSKSERYKIVAVCNSSEASSLAAIKAHKLDADTKAYDDIVALAKDPRVDVVVCSVRVDRHYPVLMPLLQNLASGKRVYCEWPLGRNLQEATELAELANSRGINTMIGLQGRRAPLPRKVKEIIESGRIGKVLSTSIVGSAFNFGCDDLESIARLFNDKDKGGNMVTIHFSHGEFFSVIRIQRVDHPVIKLLLLLWQGFDVITNTLGQLSSFSAILGIQRSETKLRSAPLAAGPGVPIVGTIPRTTPDHILLQGHLASGALISYSVRGGLPIPGTPGLVWSIYGENGEIRVTAEGTNLHIGAPGDSIMIHDHATNTAEKIEWENDQWDELPWPAKNVARLYEAFALDDKQAYADWDESLVRHRLVEEMFKRQDNGGQETAAAYVGKK